jgi:hypothetical protein
MTDTKLEGVSNNALCEAIRKVQGAADYVGWTDPEREKELLRVATHLKNQRIKPCDECGEAKEYVNEPMMSGVTGYFCVNEECPIDG